MLVFGHALIWHASLLCPADLNPERHRLFRSVEIHSFGGLAGGGVRTRGCGEWSSTPIGTQVPRRVCVIDTSIGACASKCRQSGGWLHLRMGDAGGYDWRESMDVRDEAERKSVV